MVKFASVLLALGVDWTNAQFQHHVRALSGPRQRHGGADGGMPGKRHLHRGRENANLGRVGRIVGGIDECGFGVVEFRRDLLQRRFGQGRGIRDHGQRIAAKRCVGEDSEGKITGHGCFDLNPE